ncbi:cold shock domain-containing protein [Empedobacter falsenii]
MADSTSKKENSKKKALKKLEKLNKRENRKENNNKGKSLEDMIVYVDVLGNFTDVPPHLQDKEADLLNNKRLESDNRDVFIEGMVDIYNDSKGFGFIKVPTSNDKIFFHFKESKELLKVGDQVQFKKEMSEKGFRAIQISKKIN